MNDFGIEARVWFRARFFCPEENRIRIQHVIGGWKNRFAIWNDGLRPAFGAFRIPLRQRLPLLVGERVPEVEGKFLSAEVAYTPDALFLLLNLHQGDMPENAKRFGSKALRRAYLPNQGAAIAGRFLHRVDLYPR